MKRPLRFILIAVILFAANIVFAIDVPYLTGRVTDNAEILSASMKETLSERLKAHEEKTTNQIAVLTIPSLDGESIEGYAEAVFKAWKLGQKDKDNGILLLVAPEDRRMRIEVGYGLESTLTDATAGSIIRNVITPLFKSGDYNSGVAAGINAIITVLDGGTVPALEGNGKSIAKKSLFSEMEEPGLPLTERILIGAFIFGIIGLFTIIGVMTPGVGWFLYLFLIPFWAMFPIIVIGASNTLILLITYLIGYPVAKLILRNTDWYNKAAKDLRTKGHASIGGFSVTSGGSGRSWSSGGSGGSGFSGGGGSSGGGGASGGW